METILSSFWTWVKGGIASVLNLLPDSPFNFDIPAVASEFMGYVNYFIPIGFFVNVLIAWTGCIAFFYAASIFLRWLKAIE